MLGYGDGQNENKSWDTFQQKKRAYNIIPLWDLLGQFQKSVFKLMEWNLVSLFNALQIMLKLSGLDVKPFPKSTSFLNESVVK